MLKKAYILLLVFVTFFACDFFSKKDDRNPIARVGESYLYEEDLKGLVTEGMAPEDSSVVVNNYINNWATQQLLMTNAIRNIDDQKQQEFNKLVEKYRKDLFTQTYLEALVGSQVDSMVSIDEAQKYYNENKEVFKLNEELIKFRYINLNENRTDFDEIKKKFVRFDSIDKKVLDSISIQFKSYSLNDSIWVKVSQVLDKIPVVNAGNKDQLLKKSNFIEVKDSLGVYLMHINDVLLRNDTAPLEYVKPTIDQIVINRRKLEFINELKREITKDAIKNKQFEIFD